MAKQFRRLKKNYHGRKKGSVITIDDARKAHHKRSFRAQMIDNKLKATLAMSIPEWMGNMNRRDLISVDFPGLDYPGESPKKEKRKQEKAVGLCAAKGCYKKATRVFRDQGLCVEHYYKARKFEQGEREKERKSKKKKVRGPDPKKMVKKFYDAISRPVENCSSWYSYYYLSEFVRNLNPSYKRAAKKQFKKLSGELDDAFLNYGTYAVLRELRHLKGMASIKTGKKLTKDEKKLMDKLQNLPLKSADKTHSGVVEYLTYLRKYGIDTTPKHGLFVVAEGLFDKLKWHPSYGGKSWATIARTMKQRYHVSRTIWLDMMWALQHNTGTWINKVHLSSKEGNTLSRKTSRSQKSVLNSILESKREGDMKKVAEIASYFNPQIKSFTSYFPSPKRKRSVVTKLKKKSRPRARGMKSVNYVLASSFKKAYMGGAKFKAGYMNLSHTVALVPLTYAKDAFQANKQLRVTGTQFKKLAKVKTEGKKRVYYYPNHAVKYRKVLVDKAIKVLGGWSEVYVYHPKGMDQAPLNVCQISSKNVIAIAPVIGPSI